MRIHVSILFFVFFVFDLSAAQSHEETVCSRIFGIAEEQRYARMPIGEVVVAVGKQFLGAPYAAHTLEEPGEEHLVINLQGFDCVTYVENVLALSRCIKRQACSFDAFTAELRHIRYRDGVLDGYTSRLHYFSEWIENNDDKGIVQDISVELKGESYRKTINWMSTHRSSYSQLTDNKNLSRIVKTEQKLSTRAWWYVPAEKVRVVESKIHNGDIIAMTSNLTGLDIAHVGIAVRKEDGPLYYMHAPNVKGKVNISQESLVEYLAKHRAFTGIMVARPPEPETLSDSK